MNQTSAADSELARLIEELGAYVGLPRPALDSSGACAMCFDKRTTVNLQLAKNDAGQLLFVTDLGVPTQGEEVYATLLRGNLFWEATQGATVSLSHDDLAHVVMVRSIAWRGLNVAELASALETFINTAEDFVAMMAALAEESMIEERDETPDMAAMLLSRA